MYYGPTILKEAGFHEPGMDDDKLSIILNIPLATVNALGSLFAVFVIDRLGRRMIMLRTLPGCFISLCGVAFSMYLSKDTNP